MRAGTTVRTDPGGTGRIGATLRPFEQVTHSGIEQGTCHRRSPRSCSNWVEPAGRFRPTSHPWMAVFGHCLFPTTTTARCGNFRARKQCFLSVGGVVTDRARASPGVSPPAPCSDGVFSREGRCTAVRASPVVWAPAAPVVPVPVVGALSVQVRRIVPAHGRRKDPVRAAPDSPLR